MNAFICDMCGKTQVFVEEISVNPAGKYHAWSEGSIPGQYCKRCIIKINNAISEMKIENHSPESENIKIYMKTINDIG